MQIRGNLGGVYGHLLFYNVTIANCSSAARVFISTSYFTTAYIDNLRIINNTRKSMPSFSVFINNEEISLRARHQVFTLLVIQFYILAIN